MSASTLPARAVIREVGLRDGLQAIARTLPTEQKKAWLRGAHAAGQREIEVGSFVPAKYLPQLADTAELVAFARTLPGLFVSVLGPNLRGAEAAIAAQADFADHGAGGERGGAHGVSFIFWFAQSLGIP